MEYQDRIKSLITENIEVKRQFLVSQEIVLNISKGVSKIVETYKKGNKILIAGNGGSAADAQHMAAELVGRFYLERKGLNAISLTVDSSIITSIGNDYSFEKIYSRQIEALGKEGDIFFGISTSGNSKNIIEAVKYCNLNNIFTIILTGQKLGMLDDIGDIVIKVPSQNTPRIQETHILIIHIICELIEQNLFNSHH